MNGENARMLSISSPKNSTRSGSRPVVGKTSTSPPRTAICPRSSTRSTRWYPAVTRLRASCSIPGDPPRTARIGPGPGGLGRHELGDREGRGADEPAVRERSERPGAFADEVRRGLEPRGDADAARRQERDPVFTEEPADRLGCVASVGVLGEQHAEAAPELLVECGEKQR